MAELKDIPENWYKSSKVNVIKTVAKKKKGKFVINN